ncbi:MAG: putative AMP-dependent synthetase and ligase [Rhodoferax sp.]|nr:putative AMP-dependent synthetase and ligase [Rhodoferax sp.]
MPEVRKEYHWDRLITCYANRPANVNALMARSFARSPEAVAVVDGGVRLTYTQLDVLVGRLAVALARRGVKPGDRVAVMLNNQKEAVIGVLAISRIGGVLVPLGTRLRGPEIEYIFADAQPVAILYAPAFAAELPASGPAPAMRFDVGGPVWAAMLTGGEGAATDAAPTAQAAVEADQHDAFGILYTSGTTGKPKGAVLTHLNVVHSCLHWEDAHQLTSEERTLVCVPWSHVAGLCGVVLPFLGLGGTLALMAEFKRRDFLALAQRERITHALMVPAMYGLCLLEPDLETFDLGAWRIGAYGSAPMPEPTIQRFAQAFPKLQMCNCYGATETTSPATMMPRGDGVLHAESIGRTVPCGDIRVMDEGGVELPAGEEGELWIGGPMVVPRYWRNPEATAASFVAGYWKSGDIGAVDAQGYVRIADRKKDMVNRGGFKVYPAEVESVIAGIAGVVEAAVIGHPDEILGESVIAFLNVTPDALAGLDEAAVRSYCATRMADYKVPERVVIGVAQLPRNANGKIQKADLRQTAKTLPTLSAPRPSRKVQAP